MIRGNLVQLEGIIELVKEAFEEFDTPNFRLSNILRKAIRIARLRNDFDSLWWLGLEMISFENKDAKRRISEEISPHYSRDRFITTQKYIGKAFLDERKVRKIDQKGNVIEGTATCVLSISEIEARVESLVNEAEKSVPPKGLSPFDLFFVEKDKAWIRALAVLSADDLKSILTSVGQRVHDFLSITEKQLLYGQLNSDIFEQNRQYVDTKLRNIAPEALEQLTTAYRRLGEGDPESRSHALTSCRRILKSFADKLYPARDELVLGPDGRKRKLTDNKFISRLWQFVADKISGSKSGDLLLAQIKYLGNRIDRIHDLTCKGIHGKVSKFEVNQCVIQTYLLIGDILRLADQDSAINAEIEKKNK